MKINSLLALIFCLEKNFLLLSYSAETEHSILLILLNKGLNKAFAKYDKRKIGSIKSHELGDVFRMAGQNPTVSFVFKY